MSVYRPLIAVVAIGVASLGLSAIAASRAPVGWGALSGLAANPQDPATVYAVSDKNYAVSRILTLDIGQSPAQIASHVTLTHNGLPKGYDLEGIASRPQGGFWAVSEGRLDRGRKNLLLQVAADGAVEAVIGLPEAVEAGSTRHGFEGVAAWGDRVVVAVQRSWRDDPEHHVKLAIYHPGSATWSFVHYPLSRPASRRSSVGVSDITSIGEGRFLVLERDNQAGSAATHKMVTLISLADVAPAPFGDTPPVVEKTVVADLLPLMRAVHGRVSEKPEGLTVTADGRVLVIMDNDGGYPDSSEALLLPVGMLRDLM